MNRGKLKKITAIFFAFMICFTILSRAADQAGIAVVQTERPQNMMISHSVRATGRIVQNQDLAVVTEPDQRVTAIHVREGQRVTKGDLLFELDTALIEEKILYQQQELEKQELTVEDAKSQKDVSAQQKANEQAQAAEQYSLSTKSAGVQLSRAKEQLAEAKKALKEFRKSSGGTGENSSVEESLEQALADKADAYIAAQQELTALEWKIENAVNAAIQNAKTGATLTKNGTVHTMMSDEILEEDEIDGASFYGSNAAEPDAESIEMSGGGILPLADSGADDGGYDMSIDLSGQVGGQSTGGEGGQAGADSSENNGGQTMDDVYGGQTAEDMYGGQTTDDVYGDQIIDDSAGTSASPTQAELDQIEKSVRDSYSAELQKAREKVENVQAQKEAAEAALVEYQQERLAAAGASEAETEKQLIANVKAAQQAYEDAAIAANEAAVTSGRAVAMAGIPNASNSSDRQSEITYEQMQLSLEKLEALKENDGKVYAEADGLVMKINIQTGEKTLDTTAILMADLAKGCRFTADITGEQEKYIGTGDLVTLSGGSKLTLEELEVESISADDTDSDVYHVTVQVPEDTFEIGMTATMEFVKKSEAYPITVPLSALHLDEKNQPYVLVPEEYDSVLGTEIKARKVSVTVQEKNETYAALGEGALGSDQRVIIASDKAVDDGSRVRVES